MDLLDKIKKYSRVRLIVIEMNVHEISKGYGVSLDYARQAQTYAKLIKASE